MNKRCSVAAFLGFLFLAAASHSVFAGDSVYGRVIAVKSANVVIFDYGSGTYRVRIAGVVLAPGFENEAREFVKSLTTRKHEGIRMRLEYRAKNGDMVAQLLTDDPVIGIKDVGLEVIRAGLALRQKDYDYKYGELASAEKTARDNELKYWKHR